MVVNVIGNQDICYYNFFCVYLLGNFSVFNNIFSNLGYILLGLFFLFIILQWEINYNWVLLCNDFYVLECGIFKYFGLFYVMGIVLMMEGLFSVCYYVCFNYINFQFDILFMYMIVGFCMLKFYQKWYLDINVSVYSVYVCLVIVIFFFVLGVVFGKGNMVFWIVFFIIYIIVILFFSIQFYYMGCWKLDLGIFCCIFYVFYIDCIWQCSGLFYVDCMVLLVMGNVINWLLVVYGFIMCFNDFVFYLLVIGICNLFFYFVFYIIMKFWSGERIKFIFLFCIVCIFVVWGFVFFFFFQGFSIWQKIFVELREYNWDCIFFDFFDDYDIWYFFFFIVMFGFFLVLLILDDDLDIVQWDKIYVFQQELGFLFYFRGF